MYVVSLDRLLLFVFLGVNALTLLGGCASITAVPLEPDGLAAVEGAQPGFRYYTPRPYLLVAEAPGGTPSSNQPPAAVDVPPVVAHPPAALVAPAPPIAPAPAAPPIAPAPAAPPAAAAHPGAPGAGPVPANQQNQPPNQQNGSPSTAPATDTSFIASNGTTYVAKLIYLPDYSRPMAVKMNTGLLGTTSVQMTLQDGWMLTNVSANADNSKMADVLTAAVQALSAGSTGGASKAASTAAATAKPPGEGPHAPETNVLRPGLYALDYDFGNSRVSFVCAIAYFGSSGIVPAKPKEPGACGPDRSRPPPALISRLRVRG
jgi:hypothetical protein